MHCLNFTFWKWGYLGCVQCVCVAKLLGMAEIVFSFHIVQRMARTAIKSTKFVQQIELHREFRLFRSFSNDKYVLKNAE